MNRARFPRRRDDGSFSVEVELGLPSSIPSDLLARVRAHLVGWTRANDAWHRTWSSGRRETLLYDDEFVSPPQARIDDGCLLIRFDAMPTAKWWKDWVVLRIVKELREAFPDVGEVQAIRDAESRGSPDQ